ncbi:MAG TPA: 2Fe-2S iron-sulfur cluster-binding protein [Ignavibacteriales bacterium]|nr:2Fe-2S iron-sulfur cluster-binding protein [Ignavibacteriales bacterium]
MPKIIIDGKECEFKQGQTVIEVARENGISVPHFCWHPKLSVSGNCRICLVEVEKNPKLVISCATLAADGMVVHTKNEKVVKARNSVMEMILINHPLDCPICDEAGECKLQDYAFKYSVGESRFTEEKNHKKKRVQLGPYVIFDQERCISCSRCIRFSDEIAKSPQLTFVQRGDRVTIETPPGVSFDNPYTLNTVDICPVGALTNADFRFKARVWDMSKTNSICQGCARGCNIEIWTRNNEILRLTPRKNEDVNSYWMCDFGRINTFKFVNDKNTRLAKVVNKTVENKIQSWEDGIKVLVDKIKQNKNHNIAFIASPFATLEDNYMMKKMIASLAPNAKVYAMKYLKPELEDDILIRADRTPNSTGLNIIFGNNIEYFDNPTALNDKLVNENIKFLFVADEHIDLTENLRNKLEYLVVFASNKNKLTELADLVFSISTYAEKNGTIVNFTKRLQRIKPAVKTNFNERSIMDEGVGRLEKFGTQWDKWGKAELLDCLPAWKIYEKIISLVDKSKAYETAEDVFEEMTSSYAIFKDLDYDKIGELGIQLQ